MTDQRALTDAVKTFARQERRRIDAHPALSDLEAYLADQTSEKDTERIQDHLAVCRQCADRTLRLRQSASPVKRLAGALLAMLPSPRFAYAFAALCLIAAAGASVQLVRLNNLISELQGPRTNIQFVHLNFETQRGEIPARTLETDAHYHFTLVLGPEASDLYGVEIVRKTPAGEVLEWATDDLTRQDDGSNQYLSFALPLGFLKPGSYAFRFFALADGRELLGEEKIAVRGSAGE